MTHPSCTPPSLEDLNRLLPAFDFTALLASNEESAVYAAKQKSLDRTVAIKLLDRHFSDDSGFRSTFENTARTMAKLKHPNLIGVFDSGRVDGMLYFVMEFIPGKSLQRSAQGQCVDWSQALHLVEGISSGLAHAHDHGVLHGFVEPSIILLNQKAEPKIGSFGFSHQSGDAASPFLAPELRTPGAVPNFRSDVFSVGAILYELITGRSHEQGASAPSSLTNCPPQIDAIWRKATDPEPANRYSGMRALQKEISAVITPARGAQAGASSGKRVAVVAAAPKPAPSVDARPPTAPQPATPPVSGVNWRLILNLTINAGLVYAIYLAWGFFHERRDRVARENRENQARVDANHARTIKEAEAHARASKDTAGSGMAPALPEIPPPALPKRETPEESLVRLQSALAAGKRDEMPVSAVKQGESSYLLVRESLSWPEASSFAERHGAHLAVPAAGADLTWLVNNVTEKLDVWIGAARSGQGVWALADGKPWKPSKDPSGIGTYVGVDKAGFLRAASVKVRLPFVIQWHQDGKNPGSLERLLDATKASLGSASPVYPPGTRVLEGRSFLYVARPVDWDGAIRLAELGGACLAVAATPAEIGFLEDLTADIVAPNGLWLGGSLKQKQWTWITGEPWKSARWADGASNDIPGSGLIIRPGKNWDSIKTRDDASGLIIEWSTDAKAKAGVSSAVAPKENASTTTNMDALLFKAKGMIEAADRKRSEQLGSNSRKFVSDLESHLRGLPRGSQEVWRPEVERIKACVKEFRVPAMIPQSSGIKINTAMDEIIGYCAKKQQLADDEFLATAGKLHSAFLTKLREAHSQARQAGQQLVVRSLDDSIRQAENLDAWSRSLGVEAKPENPLPGANASRDPGWNGNRRDANAGGNAGSAQVE